MRKSKLPPSNPYARRATPQSAVWLLLACASLAACKGSSDEGASANATTSAGGSGGNGGEGNDGGASGGVKKPEESTSSTGGGANLESTGGAGGTGGGGSTGGAAGSGDGGAAVAGAAGEAGCAEPADVSELTFVVKEDGSTERASWEALVGGTVFVESFEDSDLEPGVSVSSDTDWGLTIADGHFEDGPDSGTATTISFDPSVRGAGLFLDTNPSTVGTGLDVHVLFEDGASEIIEVRSDTTDGNTSTEGFAGFVGFVGSTPIAAIRIFEGNQTELGAYEVYHGDDLVFSTGCD